MVTNISILSWESNRGALELMQEVRQAMDGITREVRQTKSSLVTRADTRLDFSIPNITPTPYISYYTNPDKQLIRKLNNETEQVLANNINDSDPNFSLNSTVLKIQIRGTKMIRNAPHKFSLTEEVKLRNG